MGLNKKQALIFPWLAAELVFIAGLLLSYQWFVYQKTQHTTQLETQFYDHAKQAHLIVASNLARELERLTSLSLAIQLNLNISHNEFASYAKFLQVNSNDISALAWLELTPSHKIGSYFLDLKKQLANKQTSLAKNPV